jgi:hypothetical protein
VSKAKQPAKVAKKPKREKGKPGRPTLRTEALMEEICARLSEGVPLAEICRDPKMPAVRTVSDWKVASEEFSTAFACAREAGYDRIAYRLRMTARGKGAKDGGDSAGDVQRDKLIIETDLKLLAKWDASRYGDKIQHAGHDGGALPPPIAWTIAPVAPPAE